MSHQSRAAVQRAICARLPAVLPTCAVMVVLALAGHAHASKPIPVQLNFVATDSCGERSVFEREVERRTEVLHWVTESPGAIVVEVQVRGRDARFEASVLVRRPEASPMTRSIAGSSCQEVIEGAALIVAVIVQPEEPRPSKSPTPKPNQEQVVRVPASQEYRGWSFGGGTAAVLLSGIAPSPLPGFEVFGDTSTTWNGWSPAFRIGLRYAARSGFDVGAGDAVAAFRLISASASACPLSWLWNRVLVLRPCVTGSYGSLQGSGSSSHATQTESHPWGSAGGGLRLEVRPFAALSVEFEGATEVGLVRGRFWYSGVAFHETSRIAGRLGVGLVARFY